MNIAYHFEIRFPTTRIADGIPWQFLYFMVRRRALTWMKGIDPFGFQ